MIVARLALKVAPLLFKTEQFLCKMADSDSLDPNADINDRRQSSGVGLKDKVIFGEERDKTVLCY